MRNSKIDSRGEGSVQTKPTSVKKNFEPPGFLAPVQRGSEPSGSAVALAVPSPGLPSHEAMLKTVYDQTLRKQQQEEEAKNWKRHMPFVAVKQEWIDAGMPKKKREDGLKKASTPKLFKKPVRLESFNRWLDAEPKGSANARIILRGARRAMSALKIDEAYSIEDVKVLMGFWGLGLRV